MKTSKEAVGSPDTSGRPETSKHPRRTLNLVAGTIGHFVEWYDWYIYGLLAAVFSSQIFPSDSPFASLIAALLTYAVGFVVRPLSGIIISPLADRFGRRIILTLSVSGMALGSLIIGLTHHLRASAMRRPSSSWLRASSKAFRRAARARAPSRSWSSTLQQTEGACLVPSPTWPVALRPSQLPAQPQW